MSQHEARHAAKVAPGADEEEAAPAAMVVLAQVPAGVAAAPTVAPARKIALVLGLIVLLLSIVALATPGWLQGKGIDLGLFQTKAGSTSVSTPQLLAKTTDQHVLRAAQAFAIFVMAASAGATWVVHVSRRAALRAVVWLGVAACAVICCALVGRLRAIFKDEVQFGYSFYIELAVLVFSCTLSFAPLSGPRLLLALHSVAITLALVATATNGWTEAPSISVGLFTVKSPQGSVATNKAVFDQDLGVLRAAQAFAILTLLSLAITAAATKFLRNFRHLHATLGVLSSLFAMLTLAMVGGLQGRSLRDMDFSYSFYLELLACLVALTIAGILLYRLSPVQRCIASINHAIGLVIEPPPSKTNQPYPVHLLINLVLVLLDGLVILNLPPPLVPSAVTSTCVGLLGTMVFFIVVSLAFALLGVVRSQKRRYGGLPMAVGSVSCLVIALILRIVYLLVPYAGKDAYCWGVAARSVGDNGNGS